MTTATKPADIAPVHRELSGVHSYELSTSTDGATLHLFEMIGTGGIPHDAAVFLTPEQIVELRADLASALIVLQPISILSTGIATPAGRSLLEHVRQIFVALMELDKHRGGEVDQICAVIVSHLRSWRPIVLLASAPSGTVLP